MVQIKRLNTESGSKYLILGTHELLLKSVTTTTTKSRHYQYVILDGEGITVNNISYDDNNLYMKKFGHVNYP